MAVKGVKGTLVTRRNFDSVIAQFKGQPRLVVDVETNGLDWRRIDVNTCGYAVMVPLPKRRDWKPYYFPFRHAQGDNLSEAHLDKLVQTLTGRTITNWNTKFDLHMMRKDGLKTPALAEDVMLSAHLLNENEIAFRLKDLGVKYIDPKANEAQTKLKLLMASKGLGKGDMCQLAADGEVADYACDDVVLVELFRRLHVPALKEWKLLEIWREVNAYMVETTIMESHGLLLDVPLVEEFAKEAEKMTRVAKRRVEKLAGYEINMNSPKQLKAFLQLPNTKKETLEQHDGDNPAINSVMTFRKWEKVLTSYYRPYLVKRTAEDLLHPNIKLHGTISGRPSAEDPNLQAVPRKDKNGIYKVKNVFLAIPGYTLVSADLSQAELRLFAHHSGDPVMVRVLSDLNGDIHQATADAMGVERDDAKRINFGIVYGLGVPGLAHSAKISMQKAELHLQKWHNVYRTIKPFYKSMENRARHLGYIRLWTGRVRHYDTMRFPEHRKALSNLIQGGVAEMIRVIILRLGAMIRHNEVMRGTRMLLQVHDQILFYVPNEKLFAVLPEIKTAMERFDFSVPFKVDISYGQRWSELQKWEPPAVPTITPPKKKAA